MCACVCIHMHRILSLAFHFPSLTSEPQQQIRVPRVPRQRSDLLQGEVGDRQDPVPGELPPVAIGLPCVQREVGISIPRPQQNRTLKPAWKPGAGTLWREQKVPGEAFGPDLLMWFPCLWALSRTPLGVWLNTMDSPLSLIRLPSHPQMPRSLDKKSNGEQLAEPEISTESCLLQSGDLERQRIRYLGLGLPSQVPGGVNACPPELLGTCELAVLGI